MFTGLPGKLQDENRLCWTFLVSGKLKLMMWQYVNGHLSLSENGMGLGIIT